MSMTVDRDQIYTFIKIIFSRTAPKGGYVSLRGFPEHGTHGKPAIKTVNNLKQLPAMAADFAQEMADKDTAYNFAPPLAYFGNENGWQAREADLLGAPCISVEIDGALEPGLKKLEALLGPASIALHSGGIAADGQPKGHAHWVLEEVATGDDLPQVKRARALATALVGGDTTNIPAVHPIRWPGSVHRKAEPKLAMLIEANPDVTVQLVTVLKALEKALLDAGIELDEKDDGGVASATSGVSDEELVARIITGENLHQSLCALAYRFVCGGATTQAESRLRSIMERCEVKDDRWKHRSGQIPGMVESAKKKQADEVETDLKAALDGLPATLEAALHLISNLGAVAQDRAIRQVKNATDLTLAAIRAEVKALKRASRPEAEMCIAERLAQMYLRLNPHTLRTEDGSFWAYTGTHWLRLPDGVIAGRLQELFEDNRFLFNTGEGAPPNSVKMVTEALQALGRKAQAEGDVMRLREAHPPVINCTNGELWFDADQPQLRPHNPSSYLTSCSPIAWAPDAKAPVFEQLMASYFCEQGGQPREDQKVMTQHLLELLGYCIQARRDLKIFIILQGPGDNGKTALARVLEAILGREAIYEQRLDVLEREKFKRSSLLGKRILVDDDCDKSLMLPDGFLKQIAEGKGMSAEFKNKNEFQFQAQVVVIMLTNNWPRLRDTSLGLKTRAYVVPMPRSFIKQSECDADDPDRQRPDLWKIVLESELPGVLRALVEAYQAMRKRGGFLQPEACIVAANRWFEETQPVLRWVSECGLKSGADITLEHAYQKFTNWTMEEGVLPRFVPQRGSAFRRKLEETGLACVKRRDGIHVLGLDCDVGDGRFPLENLGKN